MNSSDKLPPDIQDRWNFNRRKFAS